MTYTMCTNILHLGMYTYTCEMVHKVSGSSSPCMRLASLPGEAMNFCVNELGADPRRKLIKNQTNLFVAAKRGDVEKTKVGITIFLWKIIKNDIDGERILDRGVLQTC